MDSMSHFRSDLADLRFNLFDLLRLDELLPEFDLDRETVEDMLREVERLATGPVAESFAEVDRDPPVYDPASHSVRMPEAFKRSYRAWMDAEWWRLDVPREAGGQPAPRMLWWALVELIQGAQAPVFMFGGGPAFAGLLHSIGTAEQQRIAELMIERRWGATMVLTEPDAGSDVGAGRTFARQQPDGSWHIHGVKRFITSGEHDLEDNIVHFVLARPEGAGPGTKGLSMFVVPKYHFDPQTGELKGRNGVYATNVEKKMGIKVSTTCELTFGAGEPAVGWLVGDVHDGIAQMFKVIEFARMQVGVKAIAAMSTGYLNALDYAKIRVQSADLTRAADKTAPRVTIDRHPDVRRILMLQKAYAEGMRALALFTATQQDAVLVDPTDEAAARLNDLLLPLVKGLGSERSYELLSQSLQVFGGSGYLQDYPIEQYIRDAKIDTLYEGTTSIQGLDLFFRKIVRDKGAALTALATEIGTFAAGEAGNGRLKEERAALAAALADVQAMVAAMVGHLMSAQEDVSQVYKVGQNTTRLLFSLGDLVVGWLLVRSAAVATDALDAGSVSERDRAFYEGKVAAARFFTTTVLPELAARRKIVESTDNALMDLPEESF